MVAKYAPAKRLANSDNSLLQLVCNLRDLICRSTCYSLGGLFGFGGGLLLGLLLRSAVLGQLLGERNEVRCAGQVLAQWLGYSQALSVRLENIFDRHQHGVWYSHPQSGSSP